MKKFQCKTLAYLISAALIPSFSSFAFSFSDQFATQDEVHSEEVVNAPFFDLYLPYEGTQLFIYDPLDVDFFAPWNASVTSMKLNGEELLQHEVRQGHYFRHTYYNILNKVGTYSLVFKLKDRESREFVFERDIKVIGDSRFSRVSPADGETFEVGDKVKIAWTPDDAYPDAIYRIVVDEKVIAEVGQEPYEFTYTPPRNVYGMHLVDIRAFDKGQEVNRISFPIEINKPATNITMLPAIKSGTAAMVKDTTVKLEALILNSKTNQPLPASESSEQLARVEFYLDDKIIGTDTTPPYELDWRVRTYETPMDPDYYSGTHDFRVQGVTPFEDVLYPEPKNIQVMPKEGAEYCRLMAAPWEKEKAYPKDSLVSFNGFFYSALTYSINIPPITHPSSPYTFQPVNCDNYILEPTQITVDITTAPTFAAVGDVVKIEGTTTLPPGGNISLTKLIARDQTGEREIKFDAKGNFSFDHTFTAARRCSYYERCDIISIQTINNLGYHSPSALNEVTILENQAPKIQDLSPYERDGTTYLAIQATDHQKGLKVAIYKDKTEIARGVMNTNGSFIQDYKTVYFQSLDLPLAKLDEGHHVLTVKVSDSSDTTEEKVFVRIGK